MWHLKCLNQIFQDFSTGLRLKWLIRKIIIYRINISLKINILPRRSTRGDLYRCCSNNKIRYIRSKRPQGSPKNRAHISHSFYEIPFCNQSFKFGNSPKIFDFSVFFSWWFEIFSDLYKHFWKWWKNRSFFRFGCEIDRDHDHWSRLRRTGLSLILLIDHLI